MRIQSTKTITLLLLAAFAATVSTAATKGGPPSTPQIPIFSTPHSRDDFTFTYCEQFAPHADKIPSPIYRDFENLCKLIPNSLTLPVYDPSATDHCKNFTSGIATAEYCNLDLCAELELHQMQSVCNKLVMSCFGTHNIPFKFTRGIIRTRNPKGYSALSIKESTSAMEALEPVCNGIPLENGAMPTVRNTNSMLPDVRQWWRDMEKLIENKEPPQ